MPRLSRPGSFAVFTRRSLAPTAVSTAPWCTPEEATEELRRHWPQPRSTGAETTLHLIDNAETSRLSPAGHFLLVHSRTHRNKPLTWYVLHVRSATHLRHIDTSWVSERSNPRDAEFDLPQDMLLVYVDALERMRDCRGRSIDWTLAGDALHTQLYDWHDPALQHTGEGSLAVCVGSPRSLHNAAVAHAMASISEAMLTGEIVQQVLVDLLKVEQPATEDRDSRELAHHVMHLLRDLNGGRRYPSDSRSLRRRRDDARIADAVIRTVLALAQPHH